MWRRATDGRVRSTGVWRILGVAIGRLNQASTCRMCTSRLISRGHGLWPPGFMGHSKVNGGQSVLSYMPHLLPDPKRQFDLYVSYRQVRTHQFILCPNRWQKQLRVESSTISIWDHGGSADPCPGGGQDLHPA